MARSGGCRARSACSAAGSSSGGPGPGLASIRLRLKAMDEAVESGGRRLHPLCPDGQLLDGQQHHASSISLCSWRDRCSYDQKMSTVSEIWHTLCSPSPPMKHFSSGVPSCSAGV